MDYSKVLVCALLYGDHHDLHKRLLSSLLTHLPVECTVHLWCNQVCKQTVDYIAEHCKTYGVTHSMENVPKYKAMGQMFSTYVKADPKRFRWVNWYDDDTYLTPEWRGEVEAFFGNPATKDVVYAGQVWYVDHLPGQWEFIQQSSWFKGKAPEVIKGKPGVRFAQGAYWWLRTDMLLCLDWPDPRLSHNGGDTLLGEAVRQQGYPVVSLHRGAMINKAKRRGKAEKPAGSTIDVRR